MPERVEAKPGDLKPLVLGAIESFFNLSLGKGKGGVARGDSQGIAIIQAILGAAERAKRFLRERVEAKTGDLKLLVFGGIPPKTTYVT